MEKLKELVLQFCKFGMVGTFCFCIDYGLMIFLTESHLMTYYASSAVSFIASVVVNYVLSMRFVFVAKEGMSKIQEIMIFITLSMVGLLLNQMIMFLAVELLGMFYALAKVFGTVMVTAYNFISRKKYLEA